MIFGYSKELKIIILVLLFLCSLLSQPNKLIANPLSQETLYAKALDMTNQGDFPQALIDWNQYLEIFPEDNAALSNRGNVRLALGDAQGDIDDQTNSIKLSNLSTDPYLNRGIAYEFLQLWDQAENDYKFVLDKNPFDPSALYNLGNVTLSKGDFIGARFLFDKAAKARPSFPIARSSKALADYQLGKLDDSELELRSIIRRYPMFVDSRAALCALLWRNGSFGEAESNWAAVIGLDARYSDKDWLLNIRRWPPRPANDLLSFLSFNNR